MLCDFRYDSNYSYVNLNSLIEHLHDGNSFDYNYQNALCCNLCYADFLTHERFFTKEIQYIANASKHSGSCNQMTTYKSPINERILMPVLNQGSSPCQTHQCIPRPCQPTPWHLPQDDVHLETTRCHIVVNNNS